MGTASFCRRAIGIASMTFGIRPTSLLPRSCSSWALRRKTEAPGPRGRQKPHLNQCPRAVDRAAGSRDDVIVGKEKEKPRRGVLGGRGARQAFPSGRRRQPSISHPYSVSSPQTLSPREQLRSACLVLVVMINGQKVAGCLAAGRMHALCRLANSDTHPSSPSHVRGVVPSERWQSPKHQSPRPQPKLRMMPSPKTVSFSPPCQVPS